MQNRVPASAKTVYKRCASPLHTKLYNCHRNRSNLHCADCCDGSDEAPGRCQDTCVAAGEQKRQELTRQVAEAEAGLQKRQAYVQEAAQKIEAWRKEAASLQAEVATLDAESNRANEARDRVQGKLSDIEKDVRELEASLVASAADGEPKEGAESAGAGAEEAGAEGAGPAQRGRSLRRRRRPSRPMRLTRLLTKRTRKPSLPSKRTLPRRSTITRPRARKMRRRLTGTGGARSRGRPSFAKARSWKVGGVCL